MVGGAVKYGAGALRGFVVTIGNRRISRRLCY